MDNSTLVIWDMGMKYVYLVTHDYVYEGHSVVSIETSAKKAIEVAEKDQGGDFIAVMQYQIGHGEAESKMIAEWKRTSGARPKYKRVMR